ncbi:hypothetical protein D1872_248320 [compost metagenome]
MNEGDSNTARELGNQRAVTEGPTRAAPGRIGMADIGADIHHDVRVGGGEPRKIAEPPRHGIVWRRFSLLLPRFVLADPQHEHHGAGERDQRKAEMQGHHGRRGRINYRHRSHKRLHHNKDEREEGVKLQIPPLFTVQPESHECGYGQETRRPAHRAVRVFDQRSDRMGRDKLTVT